MKNLHKLLLLPLTMQPPLLPTVNQLVATPQPNQLHSINPLILLPHPHHIRDTGPLLVIKLKNKTVVVLFIVKRQVSPRGFPLCLCGFVI